MMQCPKCGAALNAGDVFCGTCGQDVRAAQQPTAPIQPQPPQQQQYTPQAAYPPQQYQQPYPPQQPGYGQPPAKKRTGLVIGIVVGVLALCGLCAAVGAFGYFRFATQMPVRNVITEVKPSPVESADPAKVPQQKAFETPMEAVERFYETLSSGDKDSAAALFDETPDLSAYDGGAPTGYRPMDPAMTADNATLDVQEDWKTADARATVTFVCRRGEDGWHLVTLKPTATDDVSLDKVDEASAKKVVNDFYAAITQDKTAEARKLISAKGLEQLGGADMLKQKQSITGWQIINAGGTEKRYTVWTIIQSISGPEKWVFEVGMDGGAVKIVGWRYDENM